MAEGVKQKIGEQWEKAKTTIGPSGPPVATDAEGRTAIVRQALQAFGEGDVDGFFDNLHEDVDWEAPSGDNFPGGGTIEGRDEIKEKYLGDAGRTYTEFGFRPETYLESEDHDAVVVLGTYEGQGAKAMESFSAPAVQIWEFDRGQVLKVKIITDSAAFPPVVTEEEEEEAQKEQEEKEKKEQEKSEGKSDDEESGDGKSDDDDSDDDESKGKSDDDGPKASGDDSGDSGDSSGEEERSQSSRDEDDDAGDDSQRKQKDSSDES